MDLETMLAAKAESKVLVNGTIYDIDADCLIKDVPEEDAAKLLQNPNWKIWDGKTNRKTPSGHKRSMAAMRLIDSAGSEIDGQNDEPIEAIPPTVDQVVEAGYTQEAAEKIVAEEHAKLDGGIPPLPTEDDSDDETDAIDDPPLPSGSDDEDFDWADPSTSYSMEWLHSCADAYEVKYPKNIGAEKLVEKIKLAMYE